MYQKKFTLTHVIKNISQLNTEESPLEEHFGVPWKIQTQHVGNKYALYLHCLKEKDKENPWFVDVSYSFRVISGPLLGKPKIAERIFAEKSGFGYDEFYTWEYMLKNHVVDNAAMVECDVTIKSMAGIVRKRTLSFEDRKEHLTDVVLKIGDEQFHVSKTLLATFSPYFKTMFYSNYSEAKKSETTTGKNTFFQLLATFSPYFKTMFYSNFAESKKKKIELKEVDPEDFQQLLEIVHGELSVKPDNVEVLLYLANRFDVKMIRSRCEEFLTTSLEMTNKNKLRIADAHNLEDVKNHIFKDVKTPEDVRKLVPSNVRELDPSTVAKLLEIVIAPH